MKSQVSRVDLAWMASQHSFASRGLDANFNSPVYFQINFLDWAVKFDTRPKFHGVTFGGRLSDTECFNVNCRFRNNIVKSFGVF